MVGLKLGTCRTAANALTVGHETPKPHSEKLCMGNKFTRHQKYVADKFSLFNTRSDGIPDFMILF